MEENHAQFLVALGRAGGGDERRDPHLHWIIGGSPIAYHNCVVRAALAPEDADSAIVASQELMRAKGLPGSWHVGPSVRPTDLGDRLLRHGFEGVVEPGMAASLRQLTHVEVPRGLSVERVATETDLDGYEQVLALGFGEGPPEANWVRRMYSQIGLGDSVPWRHYLAHLDERPVATASVFFDAESAGLYFVSTAPGFRRRGIGAAISYAALLSARDLGCEVGVLGSSAMGRPIYERLGFREVCEIHVYEWDPASSVAPRSE